MNQTILLMQHIKNSFEAKNNTGMGFINLTVAHETVRHCGLTCKLLRLLTDKHMVWMVLEFI